MGTSTGIQTLCVKGSALGVRVEIKEREGPLSSQIDCLQNEMSEVSQKLHLYYRKQSES